MKKIACQVYGFAFWWWSLKYPHAHNVEHFNKLCLLHIKCIFQSIHLVPQKP